MELPSKELLIKTVAQFNPNENYYLDEEPYHTCIVFECNGESCWDINIYELMHLMKEWALGKQYFLSSGFGFENNFELWSCHCILNIHPQPLEFSDTEFEAVTKACEWILKEAS